AAIAATLSIMAIFLPVAFMTGTIGKFFFQFGVTVGVAVFLSLICALTLTPMLCAFFLNVRLLTVVEDGVVLHEYLRRPRPFGIPLALFAATMAVVGGTVVRLLVPWLFPEWADWCWPVRALVEWAVPSWTPDVRTWWAVETVGEFLVVGLL